MYTKIRSFCYGLLRLLFCALIRRETYKSDVLYSKRMPVINVYFCFKTIKMDMNSTENILDLRVVIMKMMSVVTTKVIFYIVL